jgi:hypothetical protein
VPRGAEPVGAQQMLQALMTPGEHHKAFARLAGDWIVAGRLWMDPADPPAETEGTARFDVVMNGLFVNEVLQMSVLGVPWEGRATFGFDNQSATHVSTWQDSFGSGILVFEGECTNHCREITMRSDPYLDPRMKRFVRMKTVSYLSDDDEARVEMYLVDGRTETQIGEIWYARK